MNIYETLKQIGDFRAVSKSTTTFMGKKFDIIKFEYKNMGKWRLGMPSNGRNQDQHTWHVMSESDPEGTQTLTGKKSVRKLVELIEEMADDPISSPPGYVSDKGYSQNKYVGKKYDIHRDIKEIAKRVRKELKAHFPKAKFSVRTERYAGGQSLHVNLMEWNHRVFKSPQEINWDEINTVYRTTKEVKQNLIQTIKDGHEQLNPHNPSERFYLTDEARRLLKGMNTIVKRYHMDDSDSQIDYFHTNFYVHYAIGKFDKPFKKVER